MHWRASAILGVLITFALPPIARAEVHCTQDVCVDLSTNPESGKITIHATKGRPGGKSTSHPAPKSTPKILARPVLTHPVPRKTHRAYSPRTSAPRKYVARSTPRVVKKKVTPTPSETPATSLSDQLTQLIPSSTISVSPAIGAVTTLPTLFATTSPALFATQSDLLGITVGISLSPIYQWDFGDGQSFTAVTPDVVTHIYKRPGHFTTSLTISWSGTWSTNGFLYPVLGGAILQHSSIALDVHQGPTQFRQ